MLDKFMQNIMPIPNNQQKVPTQHQPEQKKQPFSLYNFLSSQNAPKQSNKKCNTYLTISTWQTNSTKDMFDYESKKNVKVRDYKVNETGCDVYMSNESTNNGFQRCYIVGPGVYNANIFCGRIEMRNQVAYYMAGAQVQNYKAVSDTFPESIDVGNIIKVGRVKYVVKSLYNGKYLKESKHQKQKSNKMQEREFPKCTGVCKFCLSEESEDDVLISPCNCKGSCAEVHVSCLKQWLMNKVSRKSTQVVEFINYDNFICEICKQELPINFSVEGDSYSMLEEKKELDDPFILLEGVENKKSSQKNNIQIKIKFSQGRRSVSLGRGHESDIKLQDVSISRKHCFFKICQNGFEIVDNKAKFGTLLFIESGQKIDLTKSVVQVGKMILEANQKEIRRAIENSKLW